MVKNIITNFYDKEIPMVDSNHTFLAAITLDFALKKDENYKQCKYIEKKVVTHIVDNVSDFSSDHSDNSDKHIL